MEEKTEKVNFENFSHGADIGIRGKGVTLEEAFENAAMAMTLVITDPKSVEPMKTLKIKLDENDFDLLFFDWINALIFEMDTKEMLFSKFKVHIDENHLDAEVSGEKVDRIKHHPAVEIKGATLTELKVENKNHRWIAQCIVDV